MHLTMLTMIFMEVDGLLIKFRIKTNQVYYFIGCVLKGQICWSFVLKRSFTKLIVIYSETGSENVFSSTTDWT